MAAVVAAAEAAGGIDDGQRHAALAQRLQALLDLVGVVDGFDQRLGAGAAALPVGQRALRIGLDEAHGVSGLQSPPGPARWQA